MLVDDVEGGDEPFAALLVQAADRDAQALYRLDQIVAFGDEPRAAGLDFDELLVSAQIDRAEPLALLFQILELALDLRQFGRLIVSLQAGEAGQRLRLDLEIGGDRMEQRLAALARPFQPFFGSSPGFARRAHRLQRRLGGSIGFGERGLGGDASVARFLARLFGGVDLADQGAAALQEGGRRVGEAFKLALGFVLARRKLGDLRFGALAALAPGGLIFGDRFAPRLAGGRFPGERLRGGAGLGAFGPGLRRLAARALQLQSELIGRDQARQSRLGLRFSRRRLVARRAGSGRRLFKGGEARCGLRATTLQSGEPLARRVDQAARLARRLARRLLGRCRFAQGRLRRRGLDLQRLRSLARSLGVAGEIAEPVLFGQAPRRRRRRFGRGDEAVPAPEIAFFRDEPLAGLQQRQ